LEGEEVMSEKEVLKEGSEVDQAADLKADIDSKDQQADCGKIDSNTQQADCDCGGKKLCCSDDYYQWRIRHE
jgi:hypothetical protein